MWDSRCRPIEKFVSISGEILERILWREFVENLKFSLYPCKIKEHPVSLGAFQVALMVKNPAAHAGDIRDNGPIPESGRSPGGGSGHPTPVFLPGESHGQRIPVGYGP